MEPRIRHARSAFDQRTRPADQVAAVSLPGLMWRTAATEKEVKGTYSVVVVG